VDFQALTFRDVTRTYGRRRALHRVSLSCTAGEIVALLGPNGAGKSTLLSIAATILEPTSGEVRFDGRTARELGAALRARIGCWHTISISIPSCRRPRTSRSSRGSTRSRTSRRVSSGVCGPQD
jgi:ABC-type branched-subunit amino acid transport system ATPase component